MHRFPHPGTKLRHRRNILCLVAAFGLVTAFLGFPVPAVSASGTTNVTLAFDNGAISQYTLAYQQALQPHGAKGVFYVNSGTVGASGSFMTWAQLSTLAGAGNDIGGKSVNATNLTTDADPTTQVCNDRKAILSHGLMPVGFAYPGGANNATVQGIVKNCQYGNARTAGGITPGGAVETMPPANWYATKAYAPGTVTLANMQSVVTGADTRGGGWAQIVIGRVCSQALDAANYTSCSAASGHIELADLNAFLDWMANAGQAGGAPAGAQLKTLKDVVNPADTTTPTTTISCNGAACANTPYADVVSVTLAATDTGSGVASTHYTTDGSDPTLSSPTYTAAFNVNSSTSSVTVKYRSWDYAGNAEPVNTQVIQAPADSAPPTTSITCNDAACTATGYVGSVSIKLAATDTGGSGVAATYYTTDGSTPTTSSTAYSGAFQLTTPGTYDVKFFSTDNAGNAEAVQSQQVKVVPVTTKVSLTFDNGTVGQYNLAYLQALKPHGAHASFFVNSGNVSVSAAIMTWNQLGALAADGNDIGGKSVNATNLTTDPNPTAQVCNDRNTLVQHGLDPIAFAYPGGAFNATVKDIVKSCGYGVARSAGSLSPTGPTYAETLPPAAWYATRAYAPSGQVTLANMKALVSGAASHGGGWSQIVITRVCSQTADPNGYAACATGAGWIELDDLNGFLDWMGSAGQTGGAPAGATLSTVRDAAIGADTNAPVTTALCNNVACTSDTYTSTVYVTLSSTDVGSSVASTHYTTDGSAPTLSSPTYTKPIPVTTTTTLKFRSWDHAGNAEATNTLVVNSSLAADNTAPTTSITCDANPCTSSSYNGSTTVALSADDGAGWGVDATYYTTDGSTPTTSSPVYGGPFALSTPGTYRVQFFSTDLAGNAETVHSQQIVVLAPLVVVSFTFDDGDFNQYSLAYQRALKPHGMHGTFYINTGNLGSGPGFMTWPNLTTMAQDGQDIGGHTLDHIDLTSPDYTQQKKVDEVCNDRQALANHGIVATSFAYPFGAYDANAESIVQGCGYSDARRTGGITLNSTAPPYAETMPPKDPYATITWTAPTPTTSPVQLSDMKAAVNAAAAHGGGWVQFVTHEVCSQTYDASNYSTCLGTFRPMELDTLSSFMDWLQTSGDPGGAPPRTEVKSVAQVINGDTPPPTPDTTPPTTTIACNGFPCSGPYGASVQVTLAATDNTGGSGVDKTYYTTDGSNPTSSSTVYTGAFAVASTSTVKFFSVDSAGNAEQVQSQTVTVQQPDGVAPTTTIQCNGSACGTGSYSSAVEVTLSATDTGGSGVAATYYTTDGSEPTTSSTAYTGPFTVSGSTTVKFFSVDAAGNVEAVQSQPIQIDTTAPSTTISCNNAACGSGWYAGPVEVTLSATDGGSDVAGTYYTTDGSTPTTSSTKYTGAFTLLSTSTVKYFSVNTAGRAESVNSQVVQIDTTAPSTTISCNNAACGSGWYTAAVQVTLPASDDASGVAATYYTTDGSTPTSSSTKFTGAFTVSSTSTVKYFSVDTAGNAETVNSQLIRIDNTAPTTGISCNSAACSAGWYAAPVQVTLSPTDADGSGVAATYYTTDGSTPTTSSTKYTAPFTVLSTATVRYFSVDTAGVAEAGKSQQIRIDGTPPTTTIKCNGKGCSSKASTGPVTVTLSATDNAGGSGVASTHYTTDGSNPTLSSPTYTSAFTVASTTTVKFRSWDVAGNAEATVSQTIQVTAASTDQAPTAALTLTPTSGTAPVAVTANASGSTDTDATPIASYTFNFGDGSATVTQTSPTATHTYATAGTFTVTVTVADTAGLTGSATQKVMVKRK